MGVNKYLAPSLFTEVELDSQDKLSGVFNISAFDLNEKVLCMASSALNGSEIFIDMRDFPDSETTQNTGILVKRLVDFALANDYIALNPGVLVMSSGCYLIHLGDSDPLDVVPTEMILRFIYGGWRSYKQVGILDLRRGKCYTLSTEHITNDICDRVMKDLGLS